MSNVWSVLSHDSILNNVEQVLGQKLTNLYLRRNSYINRVYELEKAENKERIIVKFYRPGRWTKEMIQEEHQFVDALADQDIPVIPPLKVNGKTLFELDNIFWTIYPKKGGRALDEFDKDGWLLIGRLLAKLHQVGSGYKNTQRLIWQPQIATKQHLEILLNGNYLPVDYRQVFMNTVNNLIKITEPMFKAEANVLLHGDCHKGNLIHRPGDGVYVVDFDDICAGAPVQDLWMLLPGHAEESTNELAWFLEGYQTFQDFSEKSLQLIPALRAMRIIHFAAWCALQSQDLDFLEHFPEWGTLKYWNNLIREIQAIMLEF